MEVDERDLAFARRSDDAHNCVERSKRHRHVRWMRGDAVLRVTDDREVAMLALACGTAGAWLALVARLRHVLEVGATRSLEQVAARRREVPQLTGCPGEQRFRERRVEGAHAPVGGEVAVPNSRADAKAAVVSRVDPVVRQARDVDQQVGRLDAEPHEIDEIRASAQELRAGCRRERRNGAALVTRALVTERLQRDTSSIAATMFG